MFQLNRWDVRFEAELNFTLRFISVSVWWEEEVYTNEGNLLKNALALSAPEAVFVIDHVISHDLFHLVQATVARFTSTVSNRALDIWKKKTTTTRQASAIELSDNRSAWIYVWMHTAKLQENSLGTVLRYLPSDYRAHWQVPINCRVKNNDFSMSSSQISDSDIFHVWRRLSVKH